MKAESEKMNSSLIPDSSSLSAWPHRIAVTLACATLPLLFIGGLVTSLGAGLAVPDWPTTFGYNMFLYPWSKMIGGIFYEHSHRLVASFVGLLTVALAFLLWFREKRTWMRWLGVGALGLVIVQGILGGLRVILLQHTLAIIHACFAQAFFAFAVCLAVFTSPQWQGQPEQTPVADGGRLRRLCAVTTGLIYVQLIFGAVLRHTGERVDAHLLFAGLVALHIILVLLRVMRHACGSRDSGAPRERARDLTVCATDAWHGFVSRQVHGFVIVAAGGAGWTYDLASGNRRAHACR